MNFTVGTKFNSQGLYKNIWHLEIFQTTLDPTDTPLLLGPFPERLDLVADFEFSYRVSYWKSFLKYLIFEPLTFGKVALVAKFGAKIFLARLCDF